MGKQFLNMNVNVYKELLENELSPIEMSIVFFILYKTVGISGASEISTRQFIDSGILNSSNVSRVLNGLIAKKIVIRSSGCRVYAYMVNLDPSKWCRLTTKKKVKPKKQPKLKDISDFFKECHLDKMGVAYLEQRNDKENLKVMAKTYGGVTIKKYIRMFFIMDNDFISKAGRTVSIFKSQVPKVIEECKSSIDSGGPLWFSESQHFSYSLIKDAKEREYKLKEYILARNGG